MTTNNKDIELLKELPEPLFFHPMKLAFFYSAKSACSLGVKWFFWQIGFLKAAEFYHQKNIHRYRKDVFLKSLEYCQCLPHILDRDIRTVVLVRNPYDRVVSSYAHSIKFGYLDSHMSNFLKREVNRKNTFSFREFIQMLSSKTDLYKVNEHFRVQTHAVFRAGLLKPDYIVRVENLVEDFRLVEKELSLMKSPLEYLSTSLANHRKKVGAKLKNAADYKFLPTDAYPSTSEFYNNDLKKKVFDIYHIDFKFFKYAKEEKHSAWNHPLFINL